MYKKYIKKLYPNENGDTNYDKYIEYIMKVFEHAKILDNWHDWKDSDAFGNVNPKIKKKNL